MKKPVIETSFAILLAILSGCAHESGRTLPTGVETPSLFASQPSRPTSTFRATFTSAPTTTLPAPLPTLPSISPLGGLIIRVYGNEPESDSDYWIISPQGTPMPLVGGDEAYPVLSHDQSSLAFVRSSDPGWTYSRSQLWVRNSGSGDERQVPIPEDCILANPESAWSPDDSRLYYFVECSDDSDLWYVDLGSWQTRNLTRAADRLEACPGQYWTGCVLGFNPNRPERVLIESAAIVRPSPAPLLGYTPPWGSSWRLTEVNVRTGEYRVLDGEHELFDSPSISPDGETIAYDRGYLLHSDGKLERLVPPDFGFKAPEDMVDLVNPSWSPDGLRIAWEIAHIDGGNLTAAAIYNLETGQFQTLVTYEPYYAVVTMCLCEIWQPRALVWSPDGEYLAFRVLAFPDQITASNMDMFWEEHGALYVFDRQGEQVFSMRGVDSGVVAWSQDGQWLAFDAHNRAVGESMRTFLVVARVSNWEAFRPTLAYDRVSLLGWVKPLPSP